MDPDRITLDSIAKNFEFEKTSRQIDTLDGEELKKITKYFCKMYLKQQEVVTNMMREDIMRGL